MSGVRQGCIYKLKMGKSLVKSEELFSEHVHLIDFAKNPKRNIGMDAIFRYIDIETLEYGSQIIGLFTLPIDEFEEYFDLFWETGEVNSKLREITMSEAQNSMTRTRE